MRTRQSLMLEAWKLVMRGTVGEVQSPKPKDLEVGCLKVGTQGPFRKGQVWVIYSRMYENATVKLVHMPSLKSWEIRKVHEFAFLHPFFLLESSTYWIKPTHFHEYKSSLLSYWSIASCLLKTLSWNISFCNLPLLALPRWYMYLNHHTFIPNIIIYWRWW